jgi:uncharacterized membrane protein YbaN (DUF454 family)
MELVSTGRSGWLRKASGWTLLAAGIAGCILPVIPGIPLLLAGLLILAQDYLWAKSALGKTKRWAVHVRRRARAKRAANIVRSSQKKNVENV